MLPIISHINSNALIPMADIMVRTTMPLPSLCCSFKKNMSNSLHIYGPDCTCVFQMVQTLASNGANSIWEHSLLDPAQVQSGRRKPNPQDKVQ